MSNRVFQDDLITESLPDGRRERVVKAFVASLDYVDMVVVIVGKVVVRSGFITDYASVPRFFWWILQPWDKHKRAALVHAWLYQGGKIHVREVGFWDSPLIPIYRPTRKKADKAFFYLMKTSGVIWWKRQVIYMVVRIFGAKSYVKHPKEFNKEGNYNDS